MDEPRILKNGDGLEVRLYEDNRVEIISPTDYGYELVLEVVHGNSLELSSSRSVGGPLREQVDRAIVDNHGGIRKTEGYH